MHNKFGEQTVDIFNHYDSVAGVKCYFFNCFIFWEQCSVKYSLKSVFVVFFFFFPTIMLRFSLLSHKHVNKDSSFTAFISHSFKHHLKCYNMSFFHKKVFHLVLFQFPYTHINKCVCKVLRDCKSMSQLVFVSLVSLFLCFRCITDK